MSWTVEVQRSAEKELGALPPQIRERIANVLRAMKDDPFPHGVKKLNAREGYRIRVGDYRILFRVNRDARIIWIGAIGAPQRGLSLAIAAKPLLFRGLQARAPSA